MVRIPPPVAATQPTPVAGGPRQEGTDPPPTITARSVAVLDEASGALLYQRDPFRRAAPASITKIVTTIVALEHVPDLARVYTTSVSSSNLIACDGSSTMGLEPNDRVKLETLLYGMMLPSGNDAAEQVAVSLAGSREAYVGWMNDEVSVARAARYALRHAVGHGRRRPLLERLRHGAAGPLRDAQCRVSHHRGHDAISSATSTTCTT